MWSWISKDTKSDLPEAAAGEKQKKKDPKPISPQHAVTTTSSPPPKAKLAPPPTLKSWSSDPPQQQQQQSPPPAQYGAGAARSSLPAYASPPASKTVTSPPTTTTPPKFSVFVPTTEAVNHSAEHKNDGVNKDINNDMQEIDAKEEEENMDAVEETYPQPQIQPLQRSVWESHTFSDASSPQNNHFVVDQNPPQLPIRQDTTEEEEEEEEETPIEPISSEECLQPPEEQDVNYVVGQQSESGTLVTLSWSQNVELNYPESSPREIPRMYEQPPSPNTMALVVKSPSSFHFVVDEERVQSEWNAWEETQNRQRQEFKNRIHDMDCKVAQLLARVAAENLERNQSLEQPFLKEYVFEPLDMVVDRLSLLQDEYRYDTTTTTKATTSPLLESQSPATDSTKSSINDTSTSNAAGSLQRWQSLESRLLALETHMIKSIHQDLPQVRREKLTSLMMELLELVKQRRQQRLEAAKAEGNLARKVEDVAGRALCASYREEHAARCTAMELATQSLELPEKMGQQDVQQMKEEVQMLRQELARQRQERRSNDEALRNLIETKAVSMQRALLEAVGDPDDHL